MQELWHPFVMFLVPDNAEANVQLQALENVVKKGNRKKFTYISKKDILLTVSTGISVMLGIMSCMCMYGRHKRILRAHQ